MKITFKCRKCGQETEFETDGAKVAALLREAAEVSPGEAAEVSPGCTYIVECESCGEENAVTILEEDV